MLLANHHQQNITRAGRLARAKHNRICPNLFDYVHQSYYLRSHELRVPSSVQEPVDVQKFDGTATDPQRSD